LIFHSVTRYLGDNEEDLFAGKKKKAKKILLNAEEGEDGGDRETVEAEDLDFSSLKKKKKKRVIADQVAELDAQLEEAGVIDDKDVEVDGEDLFGKEDTAEREVVSGETEEEAWLKSDRDYTYEEVHYLSSHNVDLI